MEDGTLMIEDLNPFWTVFVAWISLSQLEMVKSFLLFQAKLQSRE